MASLLNRKKEGVDGVGRESWGWLTVEEGGETPIGVYEKVNK